MKLICPIQCSCNSNHRISIEDSSFVIECLNCNAIMKHKIEVIFLDNYRSFIEKFMERLEFYNENNK